MYRKGPYMRESREGEKNGRMGEEEGQGGPRKKRK